MGRFNRKKEEKSNAEDTAELYPFIRLFAFSQSQILLILKNFEQCITKVYIFFLQESQEGGCVTKAWRFGYLRTLRSSRQKLYMDLGEKSPMTFIPIVSGAYYSVISRRIT